MQKDDQITSLFIGVASFGAALVAFFSPAQRQFSLIVLIALLIILFVSLRTKKLIDDIELIKIDNQKIIYDTKQTLNRISLFKKIYKIENTVSSLERKMNKKGYINPMWGVVVIAFLLLFYLIFKASGII